MDFSFNGINSIIDELDPKISDFGNQLLQATRDGDISNPQDMIKIQQMQNEFDVAMNLESVMMKQRFSTIERIIQGMS